MVFFLLVDVFGDIAYTLVGDHSKHFNIDSISGTITVQNTTFLDRERQSEASFSVVAADKAPITTRRSAVVPVRNALIAMKMLQIAHTHPLTLRKHL